MRSREEIEGGSAAMRTRADFERRRAERKCQDGTYDVEPWAESVLGVLLDIRELLSFGTHYDSHKHILKEFAATSRSAMTDLEALREKAKAVVRECDEANTLGSLLHPDADPFCALRDELRRQGVIDSELA